MSFVRVLLVLAVVSRVVAAAPVTGHGAVAAWLAPAAAQEIDASTGTVLPLAWTAPVSLSTDRWFAAVVSPGQVAWLHVDGDVHAVRIARLVLANGQLAAVDVAPIVRGDGDLEIVGPPGPPTLLGVRAARVASHPPRVQLWVGRAQSPGYRWELWEDETKRWADHPSGPIPAPPDDVGEELPTALATLALAWSAAAREDGGAAAPSAVAASVLRAEALLEAAPRREPAFPYSRRVDDTEDAAGSRRRQEIEGETWIEVTPATPLTIEVEGTGAIRVDARAVLESAVRTRLAIALRGGGRPLVSFVEDVSRDAGVPQPLWSPLRHLLAPAPPGTHTYVVTVVGSPAWVRVMHHVRMTHLGDLVTRDEDVRRLLTAGLGHATAGVSGALLAAEAAWLDDDAVRARPAFERLASAARSPIVRAFALIRLAQLTEDVAGDALAARAAELIGDAEPSFADLIALVRVQRRVFAGDDLGALAIAEARPSMASRFTLLAGPAYLRSSAARSPALAALEVAAAAHPLDRGLEHAFQRAWDHDTRWATAPPAILGGETEVVVPAAEGETCAVAREEGARAFATIATGVELSLNVPPETAPSGFLRRFHLLAVRGAGAGTLDALAVELDGAIRTVPILDPQESVPFALGQGAHRLTVRGDHATVLVPCELVADEVRATHHAQRATSLSGRTSSSFTLAPSPLRGVLGIELRGSPGAPPVRLVVHDGRSTTSLESVTLRVGPAAPGAKPADPTRGVVATMPLSAGGSTIAIERLDDGPPVLVRVLVRRSKGLPPRIGRRPPTADEPTMLQHLEAATLAIRDAPSGPAVGRARLARAEVLLDLDAPVEALRDLVAARASLERSDLERAMELQAEIAAPSLVASRDGVGAAILAEGAGLAAPSPGQAPCVDANAALATSSCDGPLAAYVRARTADRLGDLTAAGDAYRRAHDLSGLPNLARAAALRYLQVQAPATQLLAFIVAVQADVGHDLEAARVLRRARAGSQYANAAASGGVRAIDEIEPIDPTPSLREMLAAPPWPHKERFEVRPGRTARMAIDLVRPIEVLVEASCDLRGATDGARCGLRLELDGRIVAEREAASGERVDPVKLTLPSGAHGLELVATGAEPTAVLFARATSSRPIAGQPVKTVDDRFLVNAPGERLVHRVVATATRPARVRVQGPTVVKLDAMMSVGQSPALEIRGGDSQAVVVPVCAHPSATPFLASRFACRDAIVVPLSRAETYTLLVTPVGAAEAAVAASLRVANTQVIAASAQTLTAELAAIAPMTTEDGRADQPPLETEIYGLPAPLDNLARSFGTVQLQLLAVYGSQHTRDPRIGDNYEELTAFYRRKLDGLPIWLLGAGSLRLRDGPPSGGFEGLGFTRIPPINLRVYARVRAFAQSVGGSEAYSAIGDTYLERSFEVAPRLYVLPRLALRGAYQSLTRRPSLVNGSATTPIDPTVFNYFEHTHPFGGYGQLLVWWVPFINVITYVHGRLNTDSSLIGIDRTSAELGADAALGTTEIIGRYNVTYGVANITRFASHVRHEVSGEIGHTVWLNRDHRAVARVSLSYDPQAGSYVVFTGVAWEASHGRGLDDYSTPEINLPQQLGQGRGILEPAVDLR